MKPRGLCRWVGHHYDAECLVEMNISACLRCGDDDYLNGDLEPAWIERFRWTICYDFKAWIGGRRRRFCEWWRCDDCGWRFGRHDPTNDHIPFALFVAAILTLYHR